MPARGCNPRYANTLTRSNDFSRSISGKTTKVIITFFYYSHRLMPQNNWQLRWGSPPFDLVQLGVTDSAANDAQQDFAPSKSRQIEQAQTQRSRMGFHIRQRL